jgi:membrane fusion protein (multidrug efflux system)
MKKRNIFIIAGFALAILIVLLLPKSTNKGMPGGPGAPGSPGSGKSEISSRTVFTIKTAMVARRDLQSYIETNGEVEAVTSVDIYPDTNGKLARLNVALGSAVRKGQVIAEIDPSKPGEVYAHSPIYAPISGTITAAPLQVGATVSIGTVITHIGVIDELQIVAKIPERDIAVLNNGLTASITLEAYPGVEFPAKVFRVSPLVDPTSRTKEIYLAFDKSDARINAGMFAKIRLNTVLAKNCLTVPEESIQRIFDKDYVFVVRDDNTVTKQEIGKGTTIDGVVQILSGVSAKDRIVVQGMQVLSDGAAIRDITKNGEAK